MERREPSYTVGGNVNCYSYYGEQPLWKTKNRATIWSCNLTPGHIPREKHDLKNMYPSVHWSTIYNSQDMETTEEWIKKMWYIYSVEYYLATKKEWNNDICSNMDGPRDCHAEWSKLEEKYRYDIPYLWSLKINDTNQPNYITERDSQT